MRYLLVCTLLIALIYVSYTRWQKPAVVVSAAELAERERALADELGVPLTGRDRALVREVVIEEAVLMREALRRGLHDDAVRARLAEIMRAELAGGVPEPTPAEVAEHFRANAERYEIGEAISFEQVFFEPTSPDLPEDTAAFLRGLKDGESIRASRIRLRGSRGKEFERDIFALEPGKWEGPLMSSVGIHFVRVTKRHPPRMPALDEIRARVVSDWIDAQVRERVADLVRRYRVQVD